MNTESNSLAVSAGLRAALGYYRLVAEIGRGGMAGVFLALFPNGDGTSRKVVLKQLHPELAMDDDFRAMFEDEAHLATRLHHENVVETYDFYSDDDLCVLVMEFLDGHTLSRVRQRARKVSNVPLSIHLHVMAEVLAGLHYVHELTDEDGRPLGIVHRDVTPSNVFITYDGRVKVVDFGIAKASTRIAETRIGVLKGKLAYMSPEAVRCEPVDRRSDIFSVGVMLWEAATGVRLWRDHDEVAIYRRLATGDLPLRPADVEIVHPELLRIVERALAVDPYQRYCTAHEMQLEIEDLLLQTGEITRAPAISAHMGSFFAVERERLQQIVDGALTRFPKRAVSQRRLRANEVSESYPGVETSDPPTTMEAATPSSGTFRATTNDMSLDNGEVPGLRPRPHGFLLAAAAAMLAIGVAFLANAPSGRSTHWPPSEATGPTRSSAVSEPLAAEPPAPTDEGTTMPIPSTASSNASVVGQPVIAASAPVAPNLAPAFTVRAKPEPPLPTPAMRAVHPSELREEPANLAKPRRGTRALDREDPWGM